MPKRMLRSVYVWTASILLIVMLVLWQPIGADLYNAIGVAAFAAWRITGDLSWVTQFFRVPAALLMLWLATVEVWLSILALNQFSVGEPLRRAWFLITISAGCDLLGTVLIQILGGGSGLNPMTRIPGWSASDAEDLMSPVFTELPELTRAREVPHEWVN